MSLYYSSQVPKLGFVTATKAPPVQNTWYTILDTTYNVELISLSTLQTNDESAAKNIDTEFTLEGTDYGTTAQSHNHNATYYHYLDTNTDAVVIGTGGENFGLHASFTAETAKLRVKMTSAAGTNQTLKYYLWYAVYE